MAQRSETYEEIAAMHWRRTRPEQWNRMRPSEQQESVTSLADQVRAHVASLLESRTPAQRPDETPTQALARVETARFHLENEAIREFLLPPPQEGPTDPNEVERLEEEYRLGRPLP